MAWNEKMSVGVKQLDTDHQKLVDMVNKLYDGISSGKGKASLGPVLDDLIGYTKTHFAREEAFFAKSGYPIAIAHKKEHDDLTKQVIDLQAKYMAGADGVLTLHVMNFLKNWLITHIQGSDKKYGPHLNSHGIQ